MNPSRIGWTDFSGGDLNFVTGCSPVSEGCRNCYARAIYERFGRDFGVVQTHEDKLERLMAWQPGAFVSKRDSPGRASRAWRPMAFVCDTGDLFHDAVSLDFILDALVVLARRRDVDWQILTKRADRMVRAAAALPLFRGLEWPANVWLGVTAENQAMADERIPLLLQVPAAVRWVSVEPMLESMSLERYMLLQGPSTAGPWYDALGRYRGGGGIGGATLSSRASGDISWVVCGAESGPNRRPFQRVWAEDLYDQCREAGTAYFGKQDSGMRPGTPLLIDGREVHEWPEAPAR